MSDQTRDEGEPQEPTEDASEQGGGDEEEAGPTTAETAEAAAPARGAKPKSAPTPPSEDKLNAPSIQTMGMLSVVAAATLLMWGAGRAACNYHEPGESLSPREVPLEARVRSPKDVGLELSQRWLTADFATAEKLVSPEFLPTIQKDKASCGAGCADRKKAKPLSVAEALAGNPVDTFVRVRTTGLPQGEVIKLYEIERVGTEWKVTRELEPKAQLPPLKDPPPSMMPQLGNLGPGQLPPGVTLTPGAPPVGGPPPTSGAQPPSAPGSAPAPSPVPAAPKPAPPAPAPAPAAPKP